MGIAAGDFDPDGMVDLLLTHLRGESNTLYRNEGGGFFEDVTAGAGLAAVSLEATGFGTAWFSSDGDRADAGEHELFRNFDPGSPADANVPDPYYGEGDGFGAGGDGEFGEDVADVEFYG